MIIVNDLRIGNIVSYNGYVYRIGALSKDFPFLDTDEFGFNIITYNNIHGVELTPELLKACGFIESKRIKGGFTIEGFEIDLDYITQDKIGYEFEYKFGLSDKWNLVHVKYLHQLQNLIYTLTGKELNTQP